ncbi:MAG: carboxypeptidase-like regulatory domain-containing protein [Alcaligenaceae bacterium]
MTHKAAPDLVRHVRASAVVLGSLLLATVVPRAHATELVGRVVDTMGEKVFESASVQVHQRRDSVLTALTDRGGFFRIEGLSSGSYSVNITLADGRSFAGRALVNGARRTQFVEFDYSRLVPPSDEDDY